MNKDKMMALIRRTSMDNGVGINSLLMIWFFEQLLKRISESRYRDNLILKGGFLLSSIMGIESRTTMDIDMALQNRSLDENTIRQMLSDILTKDMDGLYYMVNSIEPIKIRDEYPGFRIRLTGCLENIRQPVSIDIATGDPITPKAVMYAYPSVFGTGERISVLAYNLETIIAEKLETVVSRKTDNSRSKDFYDLYIIGKLKGEILELEDMKEAFQNTFSYRNTLLDPQEFDDVFSELSEDERFLQRWDIYCKKNAYVEPVPFEQVVECIKKSILNKVF